MELTIPAVVPLYPDGFFIQWSLEGATESGVYSFDVYRSGWNEGPWDLIAKGLSNQYAFIDKLVAPFPKTTEDVLRPNQLNMFRPWWYRIVVTTPSGKVSEVVDDFKPLYEGHLNDRKMEQYHRKSMRDFRLSLKFNGTKCAIMKRRHWGIRCDVCVDKKTKEIVRSMCKKCWGTGIVEGYWHPHLSYARRNVTTNTTAVTPEGKSDSNDTKFWMPDFPALEQDDIIFFFKDKSRWRVDQTVETQIRLQPVHQVVSAQAVDRSHIIYRLPMNTDHTAPLF